jgi:hypothetical protein
VLPGGSDKVESAMRSSGIKDTTVAPIISYITAKGKELRSNKSRDNADTSQNGTADTTVTAEDDSTLELASVPLQEDTLRLSEPEIQAELIEELGVLLKQRGMNPLLGTPGMIQSVSMGGHTYFAGFDVHRDTPTEILHTVLLGVVKYYWAQTIWYLKNRSKSMTLFQTRLASTSWKGLNAPSTNAEYICQYNGSLIGKHFKSLAQVMPFLIYDLVPQDVLRAWNIMGALIVLLWHTEIADVEDYLVSSKTTSFSQ